MANQTRYSRLEVGSSAFEKMLKRFGVITVMNAKVYSIIDGMDTMTAPQILTAVEATDELCSLDTLKVANVTIEGPSKTITGGQYTNPLLKFGKTARLEMQDALGNAEALEVLTGAVLEGDSKNTSVSEDAPLSVTGSVALHYGSEFGRPVTIVGESFFIDQKTGVQVPVKIIFYQFQPDSVFNLTQDAEGDATVFDMNGDLLTTDIQIGTTDTTLTKRGVFYSIIDPSAEPQA